LHLSGSAARITPMTPRRFDRRLAAAAVAVLAAYLVLAYLLAPFVWRHYEHQARLADLGARTVTAQGILGDVINVGFEGTEADMVCAMTAAGWSPSDPVTVSSSLKIIGSVAFRRPYHRAPVSPLFFEGRRQDLAFEKPSGRSASSRHHVRFWKALEAGDDGRPVWLGAATFDDGVGVSHYTGQITHHVAPDVDAERDFLSRNLVQAKKVETTYWVSGVGPTLFGRNGGGDPFFTDGEIAFARLAPGCETHEEAPSAIAPPARIAAKNAVFAWLAGLWRRLP
jgi:LssY C-terminus